MQSRRRQARRIAVLIGVLALANEVSANVGLPMVAVTVPAMVIMLVPVIALEAWFFIRDLGVGRVHAVKMVSVANLISTFVGIPVSWFIVLLLQFVVTSATEATDLKVAEPLIGPLHAAWIPGYREIPASMVAGAASVLLVPFCIASCLIEYEVIWRWFIKRPDEHNLTFDRIRRATIRANVASYVALAVITVGWWIVAS